MKKKKKENNSNNEDVHIDVKQNNVRNRFRTILMQFKKLSK